ncbi:MAG: carbohydrate binding family 9 domain-containing protein [Candidatus Aminicenantes bacterium]|nr:carbohydrate binding family 9 domain-containing protein [Candidatus Aminicenantes bacterium]
MLTIVLAALLSGLPFSGQTGAPPRKTMTAVPAGGPIRVDGVLEEPAWKTPGRSDFTQTDPLDGRPPTEKTTVWVAFDQDNVYVAARLADSRPDLVVGRLGRRDEYVDSDWFFVALDPYLDRRSGFFFGINPSGSILDGTLSNDETDDDTWDGIWESAARIAGAYVYAHGLDSTEVSFYAFIKSGT